MAWRVSETFGPSIPAAWPVEMGAYLMAMSSDDWGKVVASLMAVGGGSVAVAGYKILTWWDTSNAKQLLVVRRELASCKADKEQAESELKDERSDRVGAKERNRVENERLHSENERLQGIIKAQQDQIAEKDRIIVEKDIVIHSRDLTVADNTRRIDKLYETMADMGVLILVNRGDVRPRGS
jgi:hypothetical protein